MSNWEGKKSRDDAEDEKIRRQGQKLSSQKRGGEEGNQCLSRRNFFSNFVGEIRCSTSFRQIEILGVLACLFVSSSPLLEEQHHHFRFYFFLFSFTFPGQQGELGGGIEGGVSISARWEGMKRKGEKDNEVSFFSPPPPPPPPPHTLKWNDHNTPRKTFGKSPMQQNYYN